MMAPVFEVCSKNDSVIALLGSPLRLYPFANIPQKVIYPYARWQNYGGSAEQYLGNLPDVDTFSFQMDVFGPSAAVVTNIAKALRDAIEPHAYITRWGDQTRDDETLSLRYSFDVDWIVLR